MTETISIAEFSKLAGTDLEPSNWLKISRERVNQFADATNDHQFIHVDIEKAKKTPFGGTIAHGYLTLSVLSDLLSECWPKPESLLMGLNYGSDKVRYLNPVKVGQRIRAVGKIAELSEKRPGQWLIKTNVTVEIEDESTPALIAEILSMFIVDTNSREEI